MTLRDWVNNGWLVEHDTSAREITDLMGVADRDLVDCVAKGLSPDWRLAIAYNAALQLATAALASCGYRVAREAHHYRTIQSLALTIGVSREQVAVLDSFRKKRNISDYERAGMVSDKEAAEMIAFAGELRNQLHNWLEKEHPEFLETGDL